MEDPLSDKSNSVLKSRRISFSDDLEASSINSKSYSPLRRMSASTPGKVAQELNINYKSAHSITSDSRHGNLETKSLSKGHSLYGGGFEAILTKVSDTYKIQDILPKNSSTNHLINQEFSITSNPALTGRNLSEKSLEEKVKNIPRRESYQSGNGMDYMSSSLSSSTFRRRSVMGKNYGLEPTSFQETNGTNSVNLGQTDEEHSFINPKNEAESRLKKLLAFENRSEIAKQDDSDEESMKSVGSFHSEEGKNEVDHVLMASFTGELLKRQPTLTSGTKVPELPNITEAPARPASLATPGTQNQLLVPQSDMFPKRRGSFASTLLNAAPPPIEEVKSPQSTRTKLKTATLDAKSSVKQEKNNPPSLNVDPLPKFKQSKQRDSLKKIDSLPSNAIEAWKRLKEDSKGVQIQEQVSYTKFVGLDEVASVVHDLKSLGMDPNIISEVDKTTLKTVIGVKKWVASSKERKMAENADLRKFIKAIDHRLVNEVPKSLNTDLVNAVIPILYNLKKEYKSQLGESHEYIDRLESVIESLNIQSDFKKRKTIFKYRENCWNILQKIFQPPTTGRVKPAQMKTIPKVDYNTDDYDDDDDNLLPVTGRD